MANPVSPGGKLPPSRGAGLSAFAEGVGVGKRVANQANRLLSPDAYDQYGNVAGLSVTDPNAPLGSQVEAATQAAIFNAEWRPDFAYNQQEGLWERLSPDKNFKRASFDLRDTGVHIAANYYYNPDNDENRGQGMGQEEYSQRPADFQEVPTSSSNYKRPRTVAAGYDEKLKILTVVFRDGTFWNYYGITPGTWIIFHDSLSKGPLLNSNAQNHHGDGLLLRECSYHGPADLNHLSPEAQEFFYKVARTSQIYYANRSRFGTKKYAKPATKAAKKAGDFGKLWTGGTTEGYVPKNAGSGQKYKAAQKSARAKLGKNNATANKRSK